MPIQFLDETGNNPLPAGVAVSVYPYPGPQTAATLVGTEFTKVDGNLLYVNVAPATTYIAVFFGQQAPRSPQQFVGGSGTTAVNVSGYRSPSLSQTGYAVEETVIWPRGPGWFGDAAKQPQGNAWAVAYMLAAGLMLLDTNAQGLIERERVQSTVGPDIDSWAADFLGAFFPRFVDEGDQSYEGRVVALLSGQKCTIAGIQAIVDAFYVAIENELGQQYSGNLTYGGMGGYGTGGGYDVVNPFNPATLLPTILVWDRQSRPDLANTYDVNPDNDNGDFVIQIGFNPLNPDGWFLDHSHIDLETFLVDSTTFTLSDVAPDPRLAALVNLVKSGGTHPLYLTYIADV